MHARANLIFLSYQLIGLFQQFLYYSTQRKWCLMTQGSWILLLPDGQLGEFKLQQNCNKSCSLFSFFFNNFFGRGWGSLLSSEKLTSLHPVLEIRRMCIWQPHVKLNVAHKSSPVSLNITVLLPKDLIPSIKVIILLLYQNQPTHKHLK